MWSHISHLPWRKPGDEKVRDAANSGREPGCGSNGLLMLLPRFHWILFAAFRPLMEQHMHLLSALFKRNVLWLETLEVSHAKADPLPELTHFGPVDFNTSGGSAVWTSTCVCRLAAAQSHAEPRSEYKFHPDSGGPMSPNDVHWPRQQEAMETLKIWKLHESEPPLRYTQARTPMGRSYSVDGLWVIRWNQPQALRDIRNLMETEGNCIAPRHMKTILFGILFMSLSLSLYIYIHTHLELPYPKKKRALQNFPLFRVKTLFSYVFLWLHRRRLWCWVVDGFLRDIYILYNIYVFFAGYLRVFDGLAKPAFPPTAGFRHHNPFFVLGFSSKKTWFLSRNPLFF